MLRPNALLRASAPKAIPTLSGLLRHKLPKFLDHPSQPSATFTNLPNHFRVYTEYCPGETVTFGVWVDAGSRFETPQNNGTAHFLEHMLFKGANEFPRVDIEKFFESTGAHFQATSGRETNSYVIKCFKKDFRQALRVLAGVIREPRLSSDDIELERKRILKERDEVDRDINEVTKDHLHAAAFGDSALGMSVMGTHESIKRVNRDSLQSYIKEHFTANRMCLVAVGDIAPDIVQSAATEEFSSWNSAVDYPDTYQRYYGAEQREINEKVPYPHVSIGFRTDGHDQDYIELMLWQHLLGSWKVEKGFATGSSLSRTLALEMLATSVEPFYYTYHNTGLFGLHLVGVHHGDVEYMVRQVFSEIVRMVRDVQPEQLHRAKNMLRAQLLVESDGQQLLADTIGRQLLAFGRRIPLDDAFHRIDEIQPGDIREVGEKYLYDTDPSVAGVGPVAALPPAIAYHRMTYWYRD